MAAPYTLSAIVIQCTGMKKELEHFYIGNSYGGNQDWFRTFMMRIGGCGAETACDSSVYFALHRNIEGIYPFDKDHITKTEYVDFAHIMEKYLWPRMSGIDRLSIFVDGYSKYLSDRGIDNISMTTLDGSAPYEAAALAVKTQIDSGCPVPTLILYHRDKEFKDFTWHWFLLNGYDEREDTMLVKAVTYSGWQWMDLRRLWNTGYERKGGFIIYHVEQ